jgi:hypothetical protein
MKCKSCKSEEGNDVHKFKVEMEYDCPSEIGFVAAKSVNLCAGCAYGLTSVIGEAVKIMENGGWKNEICSN